jgi:hypothetical protein
VDPDLHHSIIKADAIDWRQLYIEKQQYIAHDTEEAMYEMFEELQNKYILSESQKRAASVATQPADRGVDGSKERLQTLGEEDDAL